MQNIRNHIESLNKKGEKALSVFLTSGFPDTEKFTDLAFNILDSGADLLEIGFPFSDPLADGPVIQHSSDIAIKNGINLQKTFQYVEQIKKRTNKPIILMGYANPVISFGLKNFAQSCRDAGVDGVIIPDVPLEEYDNFYSKDFNGIEKILLISPTTNPERIKLTDEKSEGFVYCVSMSGTTGNEDAEKDVQFIKNGNSLITKNKMLIGFGISSTKDVKKYSPFCDGVIVGSAVIRELYENGENFEKTLEFITKLKTALKI